MKHLRRQDDYWKPCRPGTILDVSDSKFRRQRRRFLVQSAMTSVVAVAGLFSTAFFIAHRRGNRVASDSGSMVDTNLVDRSVVTDLTQIPDRASRSPAPILLTCQDIARQLDVYLDAVRSENDQRTLMQQELLVNFEQHMKICRHCRVKVSRAIQDV